MMLPLGIRCHPFVLQWGRRDRLCASGPSAPRSASIAGFLFVPDLPFAALQANITTIWSANGEDYTGCGP